MGLVQCAIEAAGISTISLSIMPDVTASTGAPRIAAVEHPCGLTVGMPGDSAGQLAVLRATLQALASVSAPGTVVDLGFRWAGDPKPDLRLPQPPPIMSYLKRHPWALPRFFNRTPPEPPSPGIS